MKAKKIYGLLIAITGGALLASSFYITSQVKKGQRELSTSEKLSALGDKILSITPGTKEYSKIPSDSIQDKIREGKGKVAFYTAVAKWLAIGGSIFLILGVVVFWKARKK